MNEYHTYYFGLKLSCLIYNFYNQPKALSWGYFLWIFSANFKLFFSSPRNYTNFRLFVFNICDDILLTISFFFHLYRYQLLILISSLITYNKLIKSSSPRLSILLIYILIIISKLRSCSEMDIILVFETRVLGSSPSKTTKITNHVY